MPTMRTFADFFSLADFKKCLANERRHSEQEKIEGDRALIRDLLQPALTRFLGALLEDGELKPLGGSAGRRGLLMDAWNGLFETGDNRQRHLDLLGQRFAPSFLFSLITKTRRKQEAVNAAYDALVAKVDAGNLGWWETMVEDYCFVSGDSFNAQFRSWQIELGQIRDRQFVLMKDISVAPLAECEVEFKTGELLIADWFRIEAFTNAVTATEDPTVDINSIQGCVKRTEEYLSKHGFVSVFVGNSCPRVMNEQGALVFGHIDEDSDSVSTPSPVGSVTTDLWWATIIDRQRLVEIVAGELGIETAARVVEEYLEKHRVLRVQVAPGTHRLYFSGQPEQFTENFHSPDLAMDPSVEPVFVLSPRPLELTEKPSAFQPAF